MAISVDTVYQTVQRLLNIEQRGQLPPSDFNYFANLAQLDLFRKSFYDKAHFQNNPKGNKELTDMMMNHIDIFTEYSNPQENNAAGEEFSANLAGLGADGQVFGLPGDLFHLERLWYTGGNERVIIEQVDHANAQFVFNSQLTRPTRTFPKFEMYGQKQGVGTIVVRPNDIAREDILVEYIRKPMPPRWAGANIGGNVVFIQDNSFDFEIHNSLEDAVIDKVLFYAGVSIRQDEVAQAGLQEQQQDSQEEKQ